MTREEAEGTFGYTECAEEVMVAIESIYDDFESRTCGNCKYFVISECILIYDWDCYNDTPANWNPPKDFGCNKFVGK